MTTLIIKLITLCIILWMFLDVEYDIEEKIKYRIQTYKNKRKRIKEHNREQTERQKKWRLLN